MLSKMLQNKEALEVPTFLLYAVIVADKLSRLIKEFAARIRFGRRTFVGSLPQIDDVAEDEHTAAGFRINRDRLVPVSRKRIQRARDEVLIDERCATSFLRSRLDAVVVEVVDKIVMELQAVESVKRDAVVMVGQLAVSDLEILPFGDDQVSGAGAILHREP